MQKCLAQGLERFGHHSSRVSQSSLASLKTEVHRVRASRSGKELHVWNATIAGLYAKDAFAERARVGSL